MDSLAHGIISYLSFGRSKDKPNHKKYAALAILFGILPDLVSWTIYFFYSLLIAGVPIGKPDLAHIPLWVFTLYGAGHSIFVYGLVLLVVYLALKKIPLYLYAWGLHILIDIPTHSRAFLPTPFLWPFSTWHFPGFSWGTPWFFFSYWMVILLWIVYVVVKTYTKGITHKKKA